MGSRRPVGELSALAEEHPTREQLHAKLTLALYRSGRRVQALDVLQQLHRALRRDLGLETSPWVHTLHQAVLASNSSIEVP
ncbi:BTAD domain-containing putative transcriptional regulator [Streptomyces sulphureus]|uniref:BTAD domain-containing putative transcriptional regulator n=1 Tax=Streptomyces sulphureus TaxID=47758 RepID=UPI00039A7AA0|nr:BTAD domain-containing putative transcriptional regulator [Streptomyces sulphureus]